MTARLLLEAFLAEGSDWLTLDPPCVQGGPLGSLSNHIDEGRELYVFACLSYDTSVVWRSNVGADVLSADDTMRAVSLNPRHLEVMAELGPGDTYELEVQTDRMSPLLRRRMRWRHEQG